MNLFQRLLVAAPAVALLPASGLAQELNLEGVNKYVSTQNQATSIRQFSDVYPTDWAYQALSKLVETYGCVGGFADGTFRGNEPVTRFQMAALLASCLEKVSMSGMEMSEEMKALVTSLETELITVQGRVDGLEAQVKELEATQYIPTVKMSLEAQYDFLMAGSGDDKAKAEVITKDTSGLATGHMAKLKFSGSTNGADKLTLAVKYDQLPEFKGNYFFDKPDKPSYFTYGSGGTPYLEVDDLIYTMPLNLGGQKAKVYLGTIKDNDVLEGIDTYYGGGGHDEYGVGGEGGFGTGAVLPFGDVTLSAAYTVKNGAGTFADDMGFFGGDSTRFISAALSWRGDLVGENEAFLTGWYRNEANVGMDTNGKYINANRFTFVGGLHITDDLSISGTYSFTGYDLPGTIAEAGALDDNYGEWMFAVNMDNALFEGNSAGLAYGTAHSPMEKPKGSTYETPSVLEIYYSWQVNDNFKIPVYVDFITNNLGEKDTGGWAFGVRPSFSF